MKIEVTGFASKGLVSVNIVHGNEPPLAWDVRAYDRTGQGESTGGSGLDGLDPASYDRVFTDINAYWAQLPPNRQEDIWEVYKTIHEIIMADYDPRSILDKLKIQVKYLYDLMPLEEIKHWMLFHSSIRIPSNLKTEYDEANPPDRTYLRSDYQDLVALSIAVRPMVPIWGEYIGRTKSEHGTTFKELMALKLLYHTYLMQCVPMERLRMYIESSVQHSSQGGPSFAAVLGGLGTTELPEWLMANIVVRRISVVPVSANDDTAQIISNVHHYINNALRSLDRRFKGRVTEKIQPSASGEDPNNISSAEMYKVKQEVCDGDLVTLNVYTERVYDMAAQVIPEASQETIDLCLFHIKALENLPIHEHQVVLAQWVMTKALPARTIPLLNKPALMRALAVTQAALWQWGFYDLAAMATAEPLSAGSDTMINIIESRGRIPKELMDKLIELFPYQHHPRGKNQSVRQTNVASRAIDAFCALIDRSDWRLHAPTELIALSSSTGNTKKLIVPADMRAQLASLIIKLNSPSV